MISITARLNDYWESKKHASPCHTNRASEIGHPCERYLVYNRAHWQDKALPDTTLMSIFDLGNTHEERALRILRECGFNVTNQQRDFFDEAYNISGRIDCFLSNGDGNHYPVDVKSCHQNTWEKINSVRDMIFHDAYYIQKWPAQLQLYLDMAKVAPEGAFLLANKATGEMKEIWTTLDAEYVGLLKEKCARINEHVAERTLPKRIPFGSTCAECSFHHVCMPPRESIGTGEITDGDNVLLALLVRRTYLLAQLTIYDAAKSLEKEIDIVTKEIKRFTEGHDMIVCGDWAISGKKIQRKASEASEYWKMTIKNLLEQKTNDNLDTV